MTETAMRIGELAKLAGISTSALRYYEEAGCAGLHVGSGGGAGPGSQWANELAQATAVRVCATEASIIDRDRLATDRHSLRHAFDARPIAGGAAHRAIALWRVDGPDTALRNLDPLAFDLDGYHLFHRCGGDMLHDLGRREASAQVRALDLTRNGAERARLERRLFSQEAPPCQLPRKESNRSCATSRAPTVGRSTSL